MAWHREGEHVQALYMNQPVSGRVLESRVKYGGRVQHTLELDHSICLPWRSEPVTRVLVDEATVTTG